LVRGGKKIMGAVGSTFHFGGGLFIGLLYLVFGPGALLIHIWRVASNAYTMRVHGRARVSPFMLRRAFRCLPWNVVVSLLPFLPYVLEQMRAGN
jgi:hypothetical protein